MVVLGFLKSCFGQAKSTSNQPVYLQKNMCKLQDGIHGMFVSALRLLFLVTRSGKEAEPGWQLLKSNVLLCAVWGASSPKTKGIRPVGSPFASLF